MKKVKDFLAEWESTPATQLTVREYTMRLPIRDAARLEALAEMYPGVGISTIMTDLLSASLDELESAMPYVQGERVIEEDEFGDPVFEDKGPSRRFHQLTRARTIDLRTDSAGAVSHKNGGK